MSLTVECGSYSSYESYRIGPTRFQHHEADVRMVSRSRQSPLQLETPKKTSINLTKSFQALSPPSVHPKDELSPKAKALICQFPLLSKSSELLKSLLFVDVVQHIIKGGYESDDTLDSSVKVFEQIGLPEFHVIMQLVESNVLERKPKLSHSTSQKLLIVEWSRPTHESPLVYMHRALFPALEQMPYNSKVVDTTVEMNTALQSKSGDTNATPDITIVLARQSGERAEPELVFIGECAFSQGEAALLKKLQLEVDARPEILMVMCIIITESKPYRRPKDNSTAWKTFRNITECTTLIEFLKMIQKTDEDPKYLGPVTVAGHPWARISNIDYYVWVKQGGERIDLSKRDSHAMAHGTLFPQIHMEDVDVMIHAGLLKIRDAMVRFTKSVDSSVDTDPLSVAAVTWDMDWTRCQVGIANATERTAHLRFQEWYRATFRGTKRSIAEVHDSAEYVDSTRSSRPSGSLPSLTRTSPPLTRARSRLGLSRTVRRGHGNQVPVLPDLTQATVSTGSSDSDDSDDELSDSVKL